MQNREALKKQAIDEAIKELEKFKANPLIGVALFHFKKIINEEENYRIKWSEEKSQDNLDVLDVSRNALIEILKKELSYPKDLCDAAHAVLVVLTKYWPRNNYDLKEDEITKAMELFPQCPLSLNHLVYDKQTQDFIFYSHDGFQFDLGWCSSLKLDANGELRHPVTNAPFIKRDLDYMNSLLTLRKLKRPESNKAKEGLETGAIYGIIGAVQLLGIFLAAIVSNPAFLASLTFSSVLLGAAAIICLPIAAGALLGFIVGGVIDIYYYFNFYFSSGNSNPKISQLLNSVESNIGLTPSSPTLSSHLINKKLPESPKPVAETKNDLSTSSIKKPSSNSARGKNLAWLDKVEQKAKEAKVKPDATPAQQVIASPKR